MRQNKFMVSFFVFSPIVLLIGTILPFLAGGLGDFGHQLGGLVFSAGLLVFSIPMLIWYAVLRHVHFRNAKALSLLPQPNATPGENLNERRVKVLNYVDVAYLCALIYFCYISIRLVYSLSLGSL